MSSVSAGPRLGGEAEQESPGYRNGAGVVGRPGRVETDPPTGSLHSDSPGFLILSSPQMQDAPVARYATRASATRPKILPESNPDGIEWPDELGASGDTLCPVVGPSTLLASSGFSPPRPGEQTDRLHVALGNRISFSAAAVAEHASPTALFARTGRL